MSNPSSSGPGPENAHSLHPSYFDARALNLAQPGPDGLQFGGFFSDHESVRDFTICCLETRDLVTCSDNL